MSNWDTGDFERSLDDAVYKIVGQLANSMQKACLLVERDAKKGCPVDTGNLRASLHHAVNLNINQVEGLIGSNLEYASYIHQGTGIYARDGSGRKTPWVYVVPCGKYKGGHRTWGQRPKPFLLNAQMKNIIQIERILAGKE